MEPQQLRDKNVFPSDEVLKNTLGKRYAVYQELMNTVTGDDIGLNLEWCCYNDGKAWLGKATFKKKTIFWLSIWEGYFKVSFHFTEKNRDEMLKLNIDPKIKQTFAEAKPAGKLIASPLNIDRKQQLNDVLEIVAYKKMA